MQRIVQCIVALLVIVQTCIAQTPRASEFRVVLDEAVHSKPYTGRLYVALAKNPRREPRLQLANWVSPPQVLAVDVVNLAPGASVTVSQTELFYPMAYSDIEQSVYVVQAIARHSLDNPHPGQGEGDAFSEPVRVRLDREAGATFELRLNKTATASSATEGPITVPPNGRIVEMRSALLSAFHGRDYNVRASVVIPVEWETQPERRWPTLVLIGGFGGTHKDGFGFCQMLEKNLDGPRRFLVVTPDASCAYGHSVFADSANNGPWGRMLVEELLPEIDKQFNGGGPATRHVAGISSGGWASLWLTVNSPDQFAACWSHVPDPVDFRDFQQIDLYSPGVNMYKDAAGNRRPLARNDGGVMLWYDDFCRREFVLGRGGQIGSFEAVFGARAEGGKPMPLFDRKTGAVDPATAKSWEKYDIRLVIERGWQGSSGAPGLGEQLKGKLNIYAGGKDNFYLEGAVRRLKDSLSALGSDAVVLIDPSMGHTFWQEGLKKMTTALQAGAQPAASAPPAETVPATR